MALYLAFKEVWRNKGRFFLFALVIALITILVLFIAALAEGLAQSNKQYLEKLDADLIVYQKNTELSLNASRLMLSLRNNINRVEGVQDSGAIGFSSATLVFSDGRKNLDVSTIGVEPGKPGDPPIIAGKPLKVSRGSETVIDSNVASQANVHVGDTIVLKTLQDTKEQFYQLQVVGLTDAQKFLYQPSIFLPYDTWAQIQPKASVSSAMVEPTSNVIAVKVEPGVDPNVVKDNLLSEVRNIDVTDVQTAIESIPGYSVQQSTLNTQRGFTLLIGILVIGGFFQIQMLQKIPLIGVMKAIGTSNKVVAISVVSQIVLVTSFGVLLGIAVTLLLSIGIPDSVPIVFNSSSMLIAILTLLAIGPIGGLVSVRQAIKVEPLIALGLSQ